MVEIQFQCGEIYQPHDLIERWQTGLNLLHQPKHNFEKDALAKVMPFIAFHRPIEAVTRNVLEQLVKYSVDIFLV